MNCADKVYAFGRSLLLRCRLKLHVTFEVSLVPDQNTRQYLIISDVPGPIVKHVAKL